MSDSKIKKDYFRIYGSYPKKFIFKSLLNPNFRYLYILRKASYHKKKSILGIFYRLLLYRYQIKYGFQIYPETLIDEGFYLGHWGTVIINPKVKIGKNCNIAAGVTIGQTNRGKNKGTPIIGNEVWIGTNAVIVGNITVGTNVLIAPNAYVTEDIPDHSIVIGNPAKYSYNIDATKGYIENKI
ncbi:serine acetyltransferase [Apibacter muscae]|uniref:Serine acetyltransferase n=1 Tax=Apibacter muscae TaxID=2509004 RepID=A0A563DGT7_9FLAO|nr:serine acetyltransferase [Apibacter muscae]TWP29282.1 serine acetyltransferase [Apibacter muscae]TWP31096.1 serine acetyltransferase [Apibacter muscae]